MNDITVPMLLAEFLIKSAIIVSLGFVILFSIGGFAPAMRHSVWLRIFAAGLVIPLLLVVFPRWGVIPSPAPEQQPAGESILFSSSTATVPAVPVPVREAIPAAEPQSLRLSWPWLLFIAWILGVAVFAVRSAIASVKLRRIERDSSRPDPMFTETFEKMRAALGIKRDVIVLVTSRIYTPFTWGIIRPRIAIPRSVAETAGPDLEMILHHELEHIRRCDAFAVFVSRIFLALNWINPFAWLAVRSTVNLREEACDRGVIGSGYNADGYAEMIFRQARNASSSNLLQTSATAVAETGTIEKRIKMILNASPKSSPSDAPKPFLQNLITVLVVGTILTIGVSGCDDSQAEPDKETPVAEDKADPAPVQLDAPKTSKSATQAIETKMASIIIPSVEFVETPLEDALEFLRQRSVELDPDQEGINIVISSLSRESKETGITLSLTGVPLSEAVRYTVTLAGAGIKIDEHAIVITADKSMTMTRSLSEESKARIAANRAKLDSIVLPSIEFQDTPFTDALQFLQQRSMELDPETDENKRGINFILRAGPPVDGSGGFDGGVGESPADQNITLRLTNVPLSAALKYTCELAGFSYVVEPHNILIQKPDSDPFAPAKGGPSRSTDPFGSTGGVDTGSSDPFAPNSEGDANGSDPFGQ